ncbi:hypothetical protein H6F43_02530 [Leptolyngbya sp. FACHB-36]|uniref:hypothetical protein n=1 Tax=Leptolyngbya sp. FACHB-36 TaxID=2692808 RepID=UPI00168005F2|nr:hypothetical protein [Leptolyngbya sp. FACHB-36]MBD2019061.1 hypothetical protein [Leptolyngbya sp. FACHB-36]
MPIYLTLEHRQLNLSPMQQSLAKAAASRQAMRLQFQSQLANIPSTYTSLCPLQVDERVLGKMIRKYSEQLVYRPLEEIQHYFTYTSGAFLEPGYAPLFYSRTENRLITPSKSAIAGIGEGLAGLVAQQLFRCRKLARPNHDYPDIVMMGNGKTYLIEAKATTGSASQIQQVIEDELVRLAAYTSACFELDSRPVIGILVGTALLSETQYHCFITELSV